MEFRDNDRFGSLQRIRSSCSGCLLVPGALLSGALLRSNNKHKKTTDRCRMKQFRRRESTPQHGAPSKDLRLRREEEELGLNRVRSFGVLPSKSSGMTGRQAVRAVSMSRARPRLRQRLLLLLYYCYYNHCYLRRLWTAAKATVASVARGKPGAGNEKRRRIRRF